MSRKYKQRGYMSDEQQPKSRPAKGPSQISKDVRSPMMPGFREVFRCAMCGTAIPAIMAITYTSQCSKCQADLHTCKNCFHFDPGSRFECTQPIPERIVKKNARNECRYFEMRKIVERESSESTSKPEDARAAFERLFKK
jgi:hypothetical protein